MNKFHIASIIAGGLAAAVLGLAAPAQADVSHSDWANHLNPGASVHHVDTNVHQSR
jgi:hypothetical protein